MPNIGPVELIIILVIALLILGPGRLPDVGSALGKSIREFRKATTDVQESVKLDAAPVPEASPAGASAASILNTVAAAPPAAGAPVAMPEPAAPEPVAVSPEPKA